VRVAWCRSCGRKIVWAETERAKMMPVDAEPARDGNIVLRRQGSGIAPLAIVGVPPMGLPETERYTSHFATCPHRDHWRTVPGAPL
jgi:hypothetical protein